VTGIDVRHRKGCERPRDDGKCCGAGYQAHVFDAAPASASARRSPPAAPRSSGARTRSSRCARASRPRHADRRTVEQALDGLLDGMRDATVLDRSGRRYRPATIRSYREAADRYLKPALGRYRLGEVRRADVQRLIDRMHADGLAGSTIRNKLDPLRVVYRRAMQDDEITRTPLDNLRLPALKTKPRQVVAPERAAELLEVLPDGERALWTIAFYGGLRIGEARALRWGRWTSTRASSACRRAGTTSRASRTRRPRPASASCR
jgi:integrase